MYLAIINSQHSNKDSESYNKFLSVLLSWEQKAKACALELLHIDTKHQGKDIKSPFSKIFVFLTGSGRIASWCDG